MLRQLRRPVLTVLKWQLLATAALALISGLVAGWHGAVSAFAGGVISVAAGLSAAMAASLGRARSPGGVVMGALRGEAVKLGVALLLLWLILANYAQAVVGALIASFIVTLLIFAMAFFVRDY
ncbi:MAG TPA: ATP synthase subunit I [Burkholderiales bacterium]|nr:ATP synthase subunit I [Burkholderiales bacterium]